MPSNTKSRSTPLQRIQRLSRRVVSSPIHPSRLEVAVPFRVLSDKKVAGIIGFPAPGSASAFAKHMALPVFLRSSLPRDATPWAILSWGSALLHGLSRHPRPKPLDAGHLSWGFMPLQRTSRRESTYQPVARPIIRVSPGSPAAPTPPTTVPLAGVLNLSAASSSLEPPAMFQTGGAHGVLPFRGWILPRSSDDSSPPACPLDVPPSDWPGPRPRRGYPGARAQDS
jgi:hypothetical protein